MANLLFVSFNAFIPHWHSHIHPFLFSAGQKGVQSLQSSFCSSLRTLGTIFSQSRDPKAKFSTQCHSQFWLFQIPFGYLVERSVRTIWLIFFSFLFPSSVSSLNGPRFRVFHSHHDLRICGGPMILRLVCSVGLQTSDVITSACHLTLVAKKGETQRQFRYCIDWPHTLNYCEQN